MVDTTKQLAEQSFFIYVKDSNTDKIRHIAIPSDVQIGLKDNPAELQLLGSLSLQATDYSVNRTNRGTLNLTNNDTIASITLVDTPLSGRITVKLPANPRNGQLHFIKDASGTAVTVPIDIVPAADSFIDASSLVTVADEYGSLAVYWFNDRWRLLVAGVGATGSVSSGSSGGSTTATYMVLSSDATLTHERRLNLSGSNLTMVDNGANSTVVLNLSQILGGGAGTFTYATISVDQYGRITAASSGADPEPRFPIISNIPILAAIQSTDQVVFEAMSAFEFNPTGLETMAPEGSTSYTAYFQPIVEVYPTGVTVELKLYNVTLNSYIAASVVSSSLLTTTRLKSINLSGSLATGSNTYEMHMRITNARSGKATCKGAKLFVTWQ